MFDTDVFVLGGGPAGLAAAIAARQAGFRVIVADSERPAIDKACGEGLMPDSLAAASRLGLALDKLQAHPFRGVSFESAGGSAQASFPEGSGVGIRRTILQPALAECAREAGVELLWNCPVTGIDGQAAQSTAGAIRARWIIGADGSQSSIRRWAGLQACRRNTQRFSYRRHFRVAPWSEYMEIHWGKRCQFYVTPISSNEICLVLMTRDPHQRVADALPYFPSLQRQLSGVAAATTERGAPAATRRLRRVTRGNVALIGDASGTVDPITGEGLCLAFQQAVALADALTANDLNLYEKAHARIGRRPRFMADFMLLMDRSRVLQERTVRAFRARPNLFANLLAMHVGRLGAIDFAGTAAALGWKILSA